ncbi:DUF2812 domain-containing protein [Aerococcus sp. Group 1]|uniref:DUF2812 domain-containing protein n=1 Tax=Aerococcus urinae (strain CCUG 59500 / ACS-120-V-Col10a) TaxID=2976812 RepID=UPI000200E7F6|nr:DUF2812 domain-containing protein [Aerococcus sp. Group 1]AEA01670.1 hypothetical protein HMPREF9243_1918 [Aerococcus sp. Group 1]MCY3030349.1 DUF2812 domain-containing protein [Aerococcus sp. Group 1]MCY3055446.1 DUF2812 domain-containing protein [Aerococcus sp. Group 1]MCY3057176.1 DUF2812 domain-containing protein [Aerococcus sp. Group 1]MCY3061789.1 DUF2812 domain-containing protein [Aerococcus sp. Group 1]
MVTKYRAFLKPIEGRQNYLNQLAGQGYRLLSSGGVQQRFQKTADTDFHYTVQYIGHMTNRERLNYCDFIHDLGYKTFFAPLNIGKLSWGNVRLRPYNQGRTTIATDPGMINKEILIIESKGPKEIPAFSENEGLGKDLKRRMRPAIYLMLVALVMLVIGILVYFGILRSWWQWTYWSYRPFDPMIWPWLAVAGILFICSGWRMIQIKSLIKRISN